MTNLKIELSVVIAASGDATSLARCLLSLKEQAGSGDTEVIVASNFNGGAKEEIERQFPFPTYLWLPAETTVPELRAQGAARARGEIIALIEDNCFVDGRWCAEIKKAHLLPNAAIGGAVENDSRERSFDWAVYLSDYGKYMPPLRAGETGALPGNNLSYKRAALERMNESWEAGIFETFLNEELKRGGQKLYLAPSAIVHHRKSYDPKETVVRYYHHARGYGGMRRAGAPVLKRLVFIAGSLLLPALLPARIALGALRKGRQTKAILRSLPHLFVLMASWSLGEFCGYVFGVGSSARMWR
jgi:hypothetical protein